MPNFYPHLKKNIYGECSIYTYLSSYLVSLQPNILGMMRGGGVMQPLLLTTGPDQGRGGGRDELLPFHFKICDRGVEGRNTIYEKLLYLSLLTYD